MEHQYKTNVKNWLDTGKFIATTRKPNWIIRFLTEEYGYKCAECGISEWCNEPIVLELEHRDGNSENNVLENLCLICPNCHSQTDTYKNRNKGNGRHARRQRYAESKSY
jgi:5-methylcytosine-specific restriction endonuclease McrA